MKIRQFLQDIDLERCGHGTYFDGIQPVCPIGYALYRRGVNSLSGLVLIDLVRDTYRLDPWAVNAFAAAWDDNRRAGLSRDEAFSRALASAENVEAQ